MWRSAASRARHPLVIDPVAGAIPLEALHVGANAFAGELNPITGLLYMVVPKYVPKHCQQLAHDVRKLRSWIEENAEKEFIEFYLQDNDVSTPIACLQGADDFFLNRQAMETISSKCGWCDFRVSQESFATAGASVGPET